MKALGRSPILKRALDLVGAGFALLAFGPLMLYLAFRVRRELGSPVLFRQVRPGLPRKRVERTSVALPDARNPHSLVLISLRQSF